MCHYDYAIDVYDEDEENFFESDDDEHGLRDGDEECDDEEKERLLWGAYMLHQCVLFKYYLNESEFLNGLKYVVSIGDREVMKIFQDLRFLKLKRFLT